MPRGVPRLPRKLEPPVTPGELTRKVDDEQVSRIREGLLPARVKTARATVRRGHVQLVILRPCMTSERPPALSRLGPLTAESASRNIQSRGEEDF